MINIVVPPAQIIDTARELLRARAHSRARRAARARAPAPGRRGARGGSPAPRRRRAARAQVELFHIRGERKISLRFLAHALLGASIQERFHDSVEDARTALALFRRYEELRALGSFEQALAQVYAQGHQCGWVVPEADDGQQGG